MLEEGEGHPDLAGTKPEIIHPLHMELCLSGLSPISITMACCAHIHIVTGGDVERLYCLP